jgi:hypothetical protein
MVNVPRDWDLVQSNGFQVHIHSPQFGNELVGSGSSNNDFGDLEGNTEGSFLAFTIRWHGCPCRKPNSAGK